MTADSLSAAMISRLPWDRARPIAGPVSGGRPLIVTPATVTQVALEGFSEALLRSDGGYSDSAVRWKAFELAASREDSAEACRGPIKTIVRVRCESGEEVFEAEFEHGEQIPSLSDSELEDESSDPCAPSSLSPWQIASAATEALIDRHVDLNESLFRFDAGLSGELDRWQGRVGEACLRSVWDVGRAWKEIGESDVPRMSLIVRLAEELSEILPAVCRNPRTVLQRERALEPLTRAREVDSGCLRWLARQPGRSVAEKAGARQRVLSIVRTPSTDTLENRVVRDLILRARHACRRYLQEHRQHAPNQGRIREVSRFLRLLGSLSSEPGIQQAQRLSGVPQPNYVLQFDPRYRTLWSAYLLLVRQQMLEDNLWRWRHRLFAEHLQLGVVAALNDLCDREATHGGDVVLKREQLGGCFIDRRTALGPWTVSGRQVDFVRNDQLSCHPLVPHSLAELCPDVVLVARGKKGPRFFALWTLLDFGCGLDTSESLLESLSSQVENLSSRECDRALLILPDADSSKLQSPVPLNRGRCSCLRLAFPVSRQVVVLTRHLQSALEG